MIPNDDIRKFLPPASAVGSSQPQQAVTPSPDDKKEKKPIDAPAAAAAKALPSVSGKPSPAHHYGEDDYSPAQLMNYSSGSQQTKSSGSQSGSQSSIPKSALSPMPLAASTMAEHAGKGTLMYQYIAGHMDKKVKADDQTRIAQEIANYLKNPATYPQTPMDPLNNLIHQAAKTLNLRPLSSQASATAVGGTLDSAEEDALLAVALAGDAEGLTDSEALIKQQTALFNNAQLLGNAGNSSSDKKWTREAMGDKSSKATVVAAAAAAPMTAAASVAGTAMKDYKDEKEMTEAQLLAFAKESGVSIEDLKAQLSLHQPSRPQQPNKPFSYGGAGIGNLVASASTAGHYSLSHGVIGLLGQDLEDSMEEELPGAGFYKAPSDSSKPDPTSSSFDPKILPEKVINLLKHIDATGKLKNITEKANGNSSKFLFYRIENLIFGDLIMQRVMGRLSETAKAGFVYKPLVTKAIVPPMGTLKSQPDPKQAALHFAWCVDDIIKVIDSKGVGNLADRFIANLNLNPLTAKFVLAEKDGLKHNLNGADLKGVKDYINSLEFCEYFPEATQKDFKDAREKCKKALIYEQQQKPVLEVIIETLILAGNDRVKTPFNSAVCSVLSLPNKDRYCIQFSSNEDVNRALTVGLTLLLVADTIGPYRLTKLGGTYENYAFLASVKSTIKQTLPNASWSGSVFEASTNSTPPTMLNAYRAGPRLEDIRQVHIKKSVTAALACKTDQECYETFIANMEQTIETQNLIDKEDGLCRVLLRSALEAGNIKSHIACTFTGPASGTGVPKIESQDKPKAAHAAAAAAGAIAAAKPSASVSRGPSDVKGMNFSPWAVPVASRISMPQAKALVSNPDPKQAAEHFAWCKQDALKLGDVATATSGTLVLKLLENMKINPKTQSMCEQIKLDLISLGSDLNKVKEYIQELDWETLTLQSSLRAKK